MAGRRRGELWIVSTIAALVVLTLVVLLDPSVAPAVVNEPLDLVLNAAATLVAVAVAILGWAHYREGGDRPALIRASAFLVLAAQNLALLGIAIAGEAAELGLELARPGQLPLWSVVTGRALASALLVLAGLVALRPQRAQRIPAPLLLIGPVAVVALATGGLVVWHASLPALLDANGVRALQQDPTAPLLGASGPMLTFLQAAIGLAFLTAALISYRIHLRDEREAELYLSVGFVIAAFSQLHSALHSGSYLSLVTTGDVLRVAFYAVLLLAVAAESRADVRALRLAHAQLLHLREAEVAHATAEERARLAREIHDGMSQELWYAKLKQSRLVASDTLPEADRALATEVAGAIESALAEARHAIEALRPAHGGSFADVLRRSVADFADRTGIPADIQADIQADGSADGLTARHQAELLRIAQEALVNVRRHADATRVQVRLSADGSVLELLVADNGRGFRVSDADPDRYGLRSMRERASIIGAELHIDSAPTDGTRVTVRVPVGGSG